jgi:hypothetical protein
MAPRGTRTKTRGRRSAGRKPGIFALGLTVIAVISAGGAQAAEPIAVENIIRQGVELRRKGRDQEALPFFQRAYDLEHTPRTAAQLGLVELAMGYALAAEGHLREALSSPRHFWVSRNRAQLEAAFAAATGSIGELDVAGSPTGAEVLVNGKSAGVLPLRETVRLVEGMVDLVVRAPGHEERKTTVRVSGGKRETVAVALKPSPQQPAPPSATISSRAGSTVDLRTPRAEASAPAWVRPAAWVTGGLAVASLGVAAVGYSSWQSNRNEFNDQKRGATTDRACSTNAPDRGNEGCARIYNDAVTGQRLMYAGLSAAVVMGASAMVGFLWLGRGRDGTSGVGPSAAVVLVEPGRWETGWRFQF